MEQNYLSMTARFAVCLFVVALTADQASAQHDHNSPPINYQSSTPTDRVSQLAAAIERGETNLKWDQNHGWLKSILAAFDVPSSSQTLVFSKTSMQFRQISPSRPRAIYYNDDIYVGWVNGGGVFGVRFVGGRAAGTVLVSVAEPRRAPDLQRA